MHIKFNNKTVHIADCKIGAVIQTTYFESRVGKIGNMSGFGHIVGFGKNSEGEILMNVKTMPNFIIHKSIDEEVRSIHPANLNIFI